MSYAVRVPLSLNGSQIPEQKRVVKLLFARRKKLRVSRAGLYVPRMGRMEQWFAATVFIFNCEMHARAVLDSTKSSARSSNGTNAAETAFCLTSPNAD